MFAAGRRLILCCLLVSVFLPARAQTTLLGEFLLNTSLSNNVSGGPSLVSLGGTIGATGYVFDKNQGLTFTSTSLSVTSYSIQLSFKSNLDSTASWSKLVDLFGAASNDNGVYIYHNGVNDYRLQFYPTATGNQADFVTGTNFDVVLTRDGTVVTGYVNGALRFSFTDSSNLAVVTATNKTLTFFADDTDQGGAEASSGTANYIRIYNGALTAGEVSALYAAGAPSAVPEPAVTSLLLAGAALGGIMVRRRWGSPSVRIAA